MNKYNNPKHNLINTVVYKDTYIVNIILLLCHIFFSILFKVNDAPILVIFNSVSIIIYLLLFIVLRMQIPNLYIGIVFTEIYIFMIVNVLCLGWDYGFQLYCISFVVSALYADFYVSLNHKIKKFTVIFICFDIFTFLALRIWTYRRIPIYALDNEMLIHTFFITNALIMFTFIIMYYFIYSRTVFKLEKALVDVANSDPLTKMNNRRKMQDVISDIPDSKLSVCQPICIAMFDIDNFKQINDTYGHDFGDEVLKSFAGILSTKHSQEEDFTICRWGGEEFLVLYKYSSKNEREVYEEFEKIRQRVENESVTVNQTTLKYTVTIGLAFHKDGMSINDLIKQADEHLYDGKKNGKNKMIR